MISGFTRLVSLTTATSPEFTLVGTPETLTDVSLTIMGEHDVDILVLPDHVKRLSFDLDCDVESYHFLAESKLTHLAIDFGWIPAHAVSYLPHTLTALDGIVVDDSTVEMLPPHITDLWASYDKGNIDAFSMYPLISLRLSVDAVSLIQPENFPTLISLTIDSGCDEVFYGTLKLPSKLKYLSAYAGDIIYGDVSLDYCIVSGDPKTIPASAYCCAKVIDIDLTVIEHSSMRMLLDNISSDVERIELCTNELPGKDVVRGVEYDFSRFTKCHKLNIGYNIKATAYPPRLLSLQDECDDFDKVYPRTLCRLDTDRRLPAKEIALLPNMHDLTCVAGTDVFTNPECFSHIGGHIVFVTTLSNSDVSALLLAYSSGKTSPIKVYARDDNCLKW